MSESVVVTVKVPVSMNAFLLAQAAKQDRSRSSLIRTLVRKYQKACELEERDADDDGSE